jgi:hypothetical protein
MLVDVRRVEPPAEVKEIDWDSRSAFRDRESGNFEVESL